MIIRKIFLIEHAKKQDARQKEGIKGIKRNCNSLNGRRRER